MTTFSFKSLALIRNSWIVPMKGGFTFEKNGAFNCLTFPGSGRSEYEYLSWTNKWPIRDFLILGFKMWILVDKYWEDWSTVLNWHSSRVGQHTKRDSLSIPALAVVYVFSLHRYTCNTVRPREQRNMCYLTLSGLNLPLSSSSTTSRELLSQFPTCSGWRWFDVV